MTVILKSDVAATASMGNINGIKAAQDWVAFLDFEGENLQTKKNGAHRYWDINDVVQATRVNNSGNPISIDKRGNVSYVSRTDEVRTALLSSNRFGVLVEAPGINYFINSATPVTQTITIPASTNSIAVSCEGAGSLQVTGNVVETGSVITASKPLMLTRNSTTAPIVLTVTVTGVLTHAQVELTPGMPTTSSRITTGAEPVTRQPETLGIKRAFLDSVLTSGSGMTIVVEAMSYHDLYQSNSARNFESTLINLSRDNKKAVSLVGINKLTNLFYTAPRYYVDATRTETVAIYDNRKPYSEVNLPRAMVQAVALNGSDIKTAFGGTISTTLATALSKGTLNMTIGTNYYSPIGVEGWRGIITKCVIYDRALSDEEMKQISLSWAQRTNARLIAGLIKNPS